MKIAFIGHSHHVQTKSSDFFLKIVEGFGEIDYFWDDSWKTKILPDIPRETILLYDLLIVWQMDHFAQQFAGIHPNIVFVPMYDSSMGQTSSFWNSLTGVKILSFSNAIHERATAAGLFSLRVQYFPDPTGVEVISDWSSLRGFFWQRTTKLSWRQIAPLLKNASFSHFILHGAVDPVGGVSHILPSSEEKSRFHLEVTNWFEDRAAFLKTVAGANVNFAPRTDEGIGMAFLEAMAMGQLVVAPDRPTMNEYITHGWNGLLYDYADPRPLDFSQAKLLAERAKRCVELGREEWLRSIPGIIQFLKTPLEQLVEGKSNPVVIITPVSHAKLYADSLPVFPGICGGLRTRGKIKKDDSSRPLITVATIVFNGEKELPATIASVLRQDYDNIEYIIVDGGSRDSTVEFIREHDDKIDFWISEKDFGPYDAMNKAASLASGRWIIFMNSGDLFYSPSAVSDALRGAPEDADFIIGHHVYKSSDGVEIYNRVADFEHTWRILVSGALTDGWKRGIPCHQATFSRVSLLRQYKLDTHYRITADHDFMYRMRAAGRRFYYCNSYVAYYFGGGLSAINHLRCIEEWRDVALKFSKNRTSVRRFYGKRLDDLRLEGVGEFSWILAIKLGFAHPRLFIRSLRRAAGGNLLVSLFNRVRGRSVVKIDLTRDFHKSAVRSFSGISYCEGWGAWTSDKRVIIKLKKPVSKVSRIHIDLAHVYSSCMGKPFELQWGDFVGQVVPCGRGSYVCEIKNGGSCDVLILNIPSASAPAETGDGDDRRYLGLGLVTIFIESIL